MSKWTIGNTSAAAANKLKWHKIQDGNKTLLICDRVILVKVSWDDLNGQSLIAGKTITIDGQQYKCRALTGGNNYRSGYDAYSGGVLPNEWDNYIVNELGMSGAPSPASSDLDSTLNSTDKNSVHNQAWNWMGVYSWCQETYSQNGPFRANRGYNSARNWNYNDASFRYADLGWRPALEILNSAPLISGNDANLGDKTAPFSIVYQVSDADSDSITVTEKVNDTVIRTITNAAQNTDLELVISLDTWNGLAINTPSTITIKADDGKGGVTTRTYTFTKTNAPPTITVTSKAFPLVTWICADSEGTTIMTRIKINGTVKKTVDNPVGEQPYTINIDDLNVGDNTITIEAQDNDWSTSSVNLTCTKTGVSHPLKEVRVRYNITPPQGTAKEIVAWLTRQKDPGFDVNAAMSIVDTAGSESYSGMTKSSVDKGDIVEEQYVGQVTTAEEKLTLKFNLTRTDTAIDKAATKLLGAIS